MSNLAPGYPSEYLLTRHEPNASNTARLVKFWQQQSQYLQILSTL